MAPAIVVAVETGVLAKWCDRFQRELPDATILPRDAGGSTADPAAPRADYAVVWRPHPSLFIEQRNLKAIFNLGAGVDSLAAMPECPRDVPVIRLEDAGMAQPMAQYVLAAVLRHVYRFDHFARLQRDQRWEPKRPPAPAEVAIGVMGLGAIGSTIARTLAAQGFGVRGWARQLREIAGVAVHAAGELASFLEGLNVLVNALPLTAATAGILSRDNLVRLADGAHVINIARGAHLVEADLLDLLASGKLSGATLDVFREEPLPAGHPFWSHQSIVVTPHVAGVTLVADSVRQVADKIRLLERGMPVSGIVDWKRGY